MPWHKQPSTSSYYLLYGRELNSDGDLKKVWVEVGLPDGDFLSCLEPSQKSFHAHVAGIILNEPTINGDFSGLLYMSRIIASFDYLTGVLEQLEDCCHQQSGLRSVSECSHCPQDVGQFRSYMEANGFIGIEVENLVASSYYDTTGNIREYVEITLELAGEPLNVNEDVIGFLHRMDNAMEGVYGSLYYYDPLYPHCEKVMEVVSGTYSLPLAFRESDVSRSVSEEVVLEITTIGTVDENGGGMVHMRINIMEQEVIGKEIYLLSVDDGISYDLNEVRDSILRFFSYCGEVLGECFESGGTVPCSLKISPQITVIETYLDINGFKDLDRSAILFGRPSKLARAVCEKYILLVHPNGYTRYSHNNIYSTMSNPYQPELALGRYLSIVDHNFDNDFVNLWRAENETHLAGFFTFHALGHMARISHYSKFGSPCNSFMSSAPCLLIGYFHDQSIIPDPRFNCGSCYISDSPDNKPFESLNEFVIQTMKQERHYWIKERLYTRFIKN